MEDVVREFFEGIAGSHDWVPTSISGTLRFDLQDDNRTEHWLTTFDHGSISASRANARADCVARTTKATMASIITGQTNAMAAILRGVIQVEGDPLLLAVFRLVMAPPAMEPELAGVSGSRARREPANTGRRS
jgi:hypothetical protein